MGTLERVVLVAVCLLPLAPGESFAGGTVTGTVKDTSAVGIEGVDVYVWCDSVGHLSKPVTDPNGVFTASDLPPGDYIAHTRNEQGYIDEIYDDVPCPGGGCYYFLGTPITVTEGGTASGIDFVLDEGGRITGTVTAVGGSPPLETVTVSFYLEDPNDPNLPPDYVTGGTTDASGVYLSRSGLPTGNYWVVTSAGMGYLNEVWDDHVCDGPCNPLDGDPVAVTAGETVEDIDLELDGGGKISGTLTSSLGGGISGGKVYVYDQSGDQVTSSNTTDTTGTWLSQDGLVEGSYFVISSSWAYLDELWQDMPCEGDGGCTVTDGTPILVEAGATTSGIDMALDPGGQISGTVTDGASRAPIASAGIEIYDALDARVGTAFTDGTGSYTTLGLPSGSYRLRAYSWDPYVAELWDDHSCIPECSLDDADEVVVTAPAMVSPIDFELVHGGRIDGTVTADGEPLYGTEIQVFDDLGNPVTWAGIGPLGFSTNALPPGAYFLLTDNYEGWVDEVWENLPCASVCDPNDGTPIVLSAGTIANLEIVLDPGATLGGTVTAAEGGAPAEDVTILLYDDGGELADFGLTDESGDFTVDGLPGGSYYVRALSTGFLVGEVWQDAVCNPDCDPTIGTTVAVPAGGTVEDIDLALGTAVIHLDGFESGDTGGW